MFPLPYRMPTRSNLNSPSKQPALSNQALSCLAAVQLEEWQTLPPGCMPRKRLPRTGKAWQLRRGPASGNNLGFALLHSTFQVSACQQWH